MHAQQPFQRTLMAVGYVERLEALQPPFCNDGIQSGKLGTEVLEKIHGLGLSFLQTFLSCKTQGRAKVSIQL